MSIPSLYKARYGARWASSKTEKITRSPTGRVESREWIPARGLAYDKGLIGNLITRVKLAFSVLTGKYDALDWEDQNV
jgi:hypothetical protein